MMIEKNLRLLVMTTMLDGDSRRKIAFEFLTIFANNSDLKSISFEVFGAIMFKVVTGATKDVTAISLAASSNLTLRGELDSSLMLSRPLTQIRNDRKNFK